MAERNHLKMSNQPHVIHYTYILLLLLR